VAEVLDDEQQRVLRAMSHAQRLAYLLEQERALAVLAADPPTRPDSRQPSPCTPTNAVVRRRR
jgi:hypothetical protein